MRSKVISHNIFILEDEIDQHPRNQILTTLKDHNLVVTKSLDEAKKAFNNRAVSFDAFILDHDMRGFPEASTVKWSAYWFIDYLTIPTDVSYNTPFILHSQNTTGRRAQAKLLKHRGFSYIHEHYFGPAYIEWLDRFFNGVKR